MSLYIQDSDVTSDMHTWNHFGYILNLYHIWATGTLCNLNDNWSIDMHQLDVGNRNKSSRQDKWSIYVIVAVESSSVVFVVGTHQRAKYKLLMLFVLKILECSAYCFSISPPPPSCFSAKYLLMHGKDTTIHLMQIGICMWTEAGLAHGRLVWLSGVHYICWCSTTEVVVCMLSVSSLCLSLCCVHSVFKKTLHFSVSRWKQYHHYFLQLTNCMCFVWGPASFLLGWHSLEFSCLGLQCRT